MGKARRTAIEVQGVGITVLTYKEEDYISLTDIARHREPDRTDHLIQNWMRNRNTIEFLGVWERLNNPNFKPLEFEGFKNKAGLNSFVLTPKQWIDATKSIGIVSTQGRYGGTYAHKDIAFEFASWISVEFEHIRINSGMLIFRPDAAKLMGSYLFHFFQSENFRAQREAHP